MCSNNILYHTFYVTAVLLTSILFYTSYREFASLIDFIYNGNIIEITD